MKATIKIDHDTALILWQNSYIPVYSLTDDTKHLIESDQEFDDQYINGGEFGIDGDLHGVPYISTQINIKHQGVEEHVTVNQR